MIPVVQNASVGDIMSTPVYTASDSSTVSGERLGRSAPRPLISLKLLGESAQKKYRFRLLSLFPSQWP